PGTRKLEYVLRGNRTGRAVGETTVRFINKAPGREWSWGFFAANSWSPLQQLPYLSRASLVRQNSLTDAPISRVFSRLLLKARPVFSAPFVPSLAPIRAPPTVSEQSESLPLSRASRVLKQLRPPSRHRSYLPSLLGHALLWPTLLGPPSPELS